MFRRRKAAEAPSDRAEIPVRWRPIVLECDRLIGEIARTAERSADGPMRDRVIALRTEVTDALAEAVAATVRAGEVERLTQTMDLASVTDSFKRARREADAAAQRGPVPADLTAAVESYRRQHDSANRLLNSLEETDRHLTAMRARLTELVLTTAELALGTTTDALEVAEAQAAAVATEAHELRAAFAELS